MDFISNKDQQQKEMLAAIGVNSVDDLFRDIPKELLCQRPVADDGLSEYEGLVLMEHLAAKNTFPSYKSYLGGGAYTHHIPSLVGSICSKAEFLTSYTPYQAEASQGMLQAIFEFQSAICALTGMDVANASVYDGASACAEAVLMALRFHKDRNRVYAAKSVHPYYRSVVKQYLSNQPVTIDEIPYQNNGLIAPCDIDERTAAVLIQSPNFFGLMEDVKALTEAARKKGALVILCANPLAYGLFASAAELGADIAVGDCQPFGSPLQYGGPYAGYMACRQELVRQLPGRIVGETKDTQGRRGFVLTLQAREQHIRREKATSNICTNQALAAMASLVSLLWYGPVGIHELAKTNYQRAAYLKSQLSVASQFSPAHFNEIVLSFKKPLDDVMAAFRKSGIEPGVPLQQFYPELKNSLLVAVTETKTQEDLDRYIHIAQGLI